jgi:hypothetical protein
VGGHGVGGSRIRAVAAELDGAAEGAQAPVRRPCAHASRVPCLEGVGELHASTARTPVRPERTRWGRRRGGGACGGLGSMAPRRNRRTQILGEHGVSLSRGGRLADSDASDEGQDEGRGGWRGHGAGRGRRGSGGGSPRSARAQREHSLRRLLSSTDLAAVRCLLDSQSDYVAGVRAVWPLSGGWAVCSRARARRRVVVGPTHDLCAELIGGGRHHRGKGGHRAWHSCPASQLEGTAAGTAFGGCAALFGAAELTGMTEQTWWSPARVVCVPEQCGLMSGAPNSLLI